MGAVDSLPSGGKKFSHLKFKKKLKVAVKNNHTMSAVADNQDAINKAVYRYRHLISKGDFNPSYQRIALRKIKAEAPLSVHQALVVRKVLKRLGENSSVSHTRINREENILERRNSGFAQGKAPSNKSGLSGVSEPNNIKKASRPMVSIGQIASKNKRAENRSTGLASGFNRSSNASSSPSRPPMIPLSH